jgi:hypothetical protein
MSSSKDYLAGLVKLEFAWILAREQHLSEDLVSPALFFKINLAIAGAVKSLTRFYEKKRPADGFIV